MKKKISQLPIEDHYSNFKGNDTLKHLLDLQASIQKNTFNYDLDEIRKSLGSCYDYFAWNNSAMIDELAEFREALGGIDSHGKALWKPWKALHTEAREKRFDDLSESELIELKFEWIDLLHFMLNLASLIKLTPSEMFNMYLAKNAEVVNRKLNNY